MNGTPQLVSTLAESTIRNVSGTARELKAFKVQRALDIILVLLMSPVLVFISVFIAILIKIDSRGSVLYSTTVIGHLGKPFVYYKFRTMLPDSDGPIHRDYVRLNMQEGKPSGVNANGDPIYKTALTDASRITRFGAWLRRNSLDELPQFWNVLRGEMSIVGPRPAMPYEAELYSELQRKRFEVLPGITGWYQILARNRVSIRDMITLDLEYVAMKNLWLDLKIMLLTPMAMFRGL